MTLNEKRLAAEISALKAKVTALNMLVEMLFIRELSKTADPAAASNALIDYLLRIDESVQQKGGGAYALQISEELTSLIDRATQAALIQRRTEGPSR